MIGTLNLPHIHYLDGCRSAPGMPLFNITGTNIQYTVQIYSTLYMVHSSLYKYTVHCTNIQYTVQIYSTLYKYTVHCTWYIVHCSNIQYTVQTVHCINIQYTVQIYSTLHKYAAHCTWYIVHCTLYEPIALYTSHFRLISYIHNRKSNHVFVE